MKGNLVISCLFLVISHHYIGQNASLNNPIVEWDSIRGTWLIESVKALSEHKAVPDRTFSEDLTPFELATLVPIPVRNQVQENALALRSPNPYEQLLISLVNATLCWNIQGRSFGDPHVVTFDKTGYSFQTVGEFTLARSEGKFEIQTRQKPQRDDFSLNTAVAASLYGDRICYYAEDIPDGSNQPLWLNGRPLQLQGRTYFLPHGGTIRLVGRNYILSGPLGEKIILDVRGGNNGFINVTFEIPSCTVQNLTGLLGNGNGNSMDEFNANRTSNSPLMAGFVSMTTPEFSALGEEMEQRYQNQLIKEFAELHRVVKDSSLFDYKPGLTSDFYTDRSFPRVVRTFSSIPNANRDAARERCRQMGVSDSELNGCIFDAYYLNLVPNPIPSPPPATEGVILDRVRRPIVNNNSVVPDKTPQVDPAPKPETSPNEQQNGTIKPSKEDNPSKPVISFPDIKPSKTDSPASTPKPKEPGVQKPSNNSPSKPISTPAKGGKGKN